MKLLESRFYSVLVFISNIFLLNILWLIFCIPIITIFPATAAMFGVVRQWIVNKEYRVFQPFFELFKGNFKQSLIIEIVWVLLAGFLYLDYTISVNLGFMQNIILPVVYIIGFIVIFISVFLFPSMVHYQVTIKQIVKNSMLFSLSYFPITLLNCIIIALSAVLLYVFPLSVLFIFSLSSYRIYFLCQFAFKKVERQMEFKETIQ
jgi:uncharacterized membrane protein YesL